MMAHAGGQASSGDDQAAARRVRHAGVATRQLRSPAMARQAPHHLDEAAPDLPGGGLPYDIAWGWPSTCQGTQCSRPCSLRHSQLAEIATPSSCAGSCQGRPAASLSSTSDLRRTGRCARSGPTTARRNWGPPDGVAADAFQNRSRFCRKSASEHSQEFRLAVCAWPEPDNLSHYTCSWAVAGVTAEGDSWSRRASNADKRK